MSKYTIQNQIDYLQRTVDEFSKTLAQDNGPEWMKECVEIEKSIINTLKNHQMVAANLPHLVPSTPAKPVEFNEDAIGSNIKIKVKLLHEIDMLKERLQGSQNPDNNYATLLHEKEEALKWTNQTLRDLKQRQVEHLQQRITVLDREIEQSFDAFRIDEMNEVRRDMVRKIELIQAELKTL